MKISRARLLIGACVFVVALGGIGFAVLRSRRAPMTHDEAFRLGKKFLDEGKLREAYSHFHHAARTRPEEPSYHWEAAKAAQALGNGRAAADHAKEAWNRGFKNRDVFILRAGDASGDPRTRLQKGLQWLKELPDSPERKELEGDLHQSIGENAEGLRIWSALYDTSPSPGLANKIALAHVALDRPQSGHAFLRSCRSKGALDEEGYSLLGSLTAYAGNPEEAASIFAEGRAKHEAGENLRFTEAVFLVWWDRLGDAAALLEPMKRPSPDPAKAALRGQARIFLGFIAATQADLKPLDELASLAGGEGPALEGERLFYRGLKEKSAEALKKARLLLKGQPVCEWALARELARAGAWLDAVEAYRRVPGLLARAPILQIELANALRRSGKSAEALDTLRTLHSRGTFTRASLEMFRDLALQKGLGTEASEAQARLQSKFGDDPGVAVAGGIMALHAGRVEEAAAILDKLSARHPGREDVELSQLTLLFARKDYEGVLKAAAASRATPEAMAPIQAAALAMLGRDDEASALYDKVLAGRRDPLSLVSYANLLLRREKTDRAAALYREAVLLDPKNGVAHLGLAFVELGRKNWAAARGHAEAASAGAPMAQAHVLLAEIDLNDGRPDRALEACAKALGLDSKDERAHFLTGVACLELGRLDEAEPILRKAAAAQPDSVNSQVQFARVLLARGSFADALSVVDGALSRKLPGDLPLRTQRVIVLARLGRAADARGQLEAIRGHLPPERFTLTEAWLLNQQGKTSEAAERLRTQLGDRHAAYFWAELALAEGRAQGVIEALDRHAYDAARWSRLGEIAWRKDLMGPAAECFRRAHRREPENAQHLNNFAYASLQSGSFDEAEVLAAAKKVHTMLPAHPSIVHTYASVLLRCRKERDCLELLDKSPALTQRTARLLLVKAQAHERLEQWEPAAKAYADCLANPETESVQSGELSRPALKQRLEQVRARSENR